MENRISYAEGHEFSENNDLSEMGWVEFRVAATFCVVDAAQGAHSYCDQALFED